MLYVSVALSLILMLMANVAVYGGNGWRVAFYLCGATLAFGTACVGLVLPLVIILFVALAVAILPWFRRRWLFHPISALAMIITFVLVGSSALCDQQEYARLRSMFPYESMEDRLPTPRSTYHLEPIPETTAQRLNDSEELLSGSFGALRIYLLEELHEHATSLFINSPGFGVTRMYPPTESGLTSKLPPDNRVPQPMSRFSSPWFLEDVKWELTPIKDDFFKIHRESVLDFANPRGYGFIKDRRHVAGFQTHQFSAVPVSGEEQQWWAVQRLDLVSLLLHNEPVAYDSDFLPRMDELRGATTRSLDAFEQSSLGKITQGEDFAIGVSGDRVRMLGSIRSTKQCVKCHGGERGDLLGAFSYALKRIQQ